MTLEDAIRSAASTGRLDRTSIVRDPAGRGWQINTPSTHEKSAWTVVIDADPVMGLLRALGGEVAQPSGGIFD